MRLPKRAPRQVYRVYDEQEFFDEGPPPDPPALVSQSGHIEREAPPYRNDRAGQAPDLHRPLPLARALLVVAVLAAGAVAFDAVSTLRRGRSRGRTHAPVSRPGAARGLHSANTVVRHVRRGVRRPGDSAIRRTTGRPGPRSGQILVGAGGSQVQRLERSASPETGEFSFERRARP